MGAILLKGGPSVIDEITVEGGERIGTSLIRAESGLHVGQEWNPSTRESALQALLRLPYIDRVTLPSKSRARGHVSVTIRVEEREPYGIVSLTGRGLYWIDRDGYLLGPVEGKTYLPVATGFRTLATPKGERIAPEAARRALREFYALEGHRIRRFTQMRFRGYDLELHLREGGRLLLSLGGFQGQLAQLEAVMAALGNSRWRTIDLRFEGEVITEP